MKKTLLVMAAGAGSRFGGLKQIEPIGKNGEILLDYSVNDAKNAGFEKVVFVIKKEMESDFRQIIGKHTEKVIDVEYAFQELGDLPGGVVCASERTKPWGTVQAVLCARDVIDTPFVVVNSDDYYGKSAYQVVADHFDASDEMCMVAYKLKNTLSDNGTVTRGVCEVRDGYLSNISEHYNIGKDTLLPPETDVSMNMWGFTPEIFGKLESGFMGFLDKLEDKLKGEYVLPNFVGELIKNENAKVKVLRSPDKWIGMTYREDLEFVRNAMKDYIF